MTEFYTRAQYMADPAHLVGATKSSRMAAHRRYYGQFVTPGTISRVVNAIGEDVLRASKDPHLNDIPLALWDRLVPGLPGSGGFSKAGDHYTVGNGVCLAKEAARQWIETKKD
jgi:hypothetical protein